MLENISFLKYKKKTNELTNTIRDEHIKQEQTFDIIQYKVQQQQQNCISNHTYENAFGITNGVKFNFDLVPCFDFFFSIFVAAAIFVYG